MAEGGTHGANALGTVAIQTHGCKLNQADSAAIARRFIQVGYKIVEPSEPADIYVVNTCTVTHTADSKARQALRAARYKNPSALVVATGCYAQRDPEGLARVKGVDLVVDNSRKDMLVEVVQAARGDRPVPCAIGEESPLSIGLGLGRTRAMVKIQEGCDQVCAYCIVPKVRGRERSIPPETLRSQINQYVKESYKEVVLTGTQLGSYGFDLDGINLSGLVEYLLRETRVERLRVSSLQPQEITDELLRLWDAPRLCPHFHMPLQSGSDHVLKRMRRRYTVSQYRDAVDRVRQRVEGVSITADVIVGFPGEDEGHFQESLQTVQNMDFASMHVFPYSIRPGTSAAFMGPQVDEKVKRKRMGEMLAVAGAQSSAFRQGSLGTVRHVLWEREDAGGGRLYYIGLTDNYLKVYTESDASLLNRITPARLLSEVGESLWVEAL